MALNDQQPGHNDLLQDDFRRKLHELEMKAQTPFSQAFLNAASSLRASILREDSVLLDEEKKKEQLRILEWKTVEQQRAEAQQKSYERVKEIIYDDKPISTPKQMDELEGHLKVLASAKTVLKTEETILLGDKCRNARDCGILDPHKHVEGDKRASNHGIVKQAAANVLGIDADKLTLADMKKINADPDLKARVKEQARVIASNATKDSPEGRIRDFDMNSSLNNMNQDEIRDLDKKVEKRDAITDIARPVEKKLEAEGLAKEEAKKEAEKIAEKVIQQTDIPKTDEEKKAAMDKAKAEADKVIAPAPAQQQPSQLSPAEAPQSIAANTPSPSVSPTKLQNQNSGQTQGASLA